MALVQKLVKIDSYDATNTLIPAGHIGTFDTERLSGKEEHLVDVAADYAPVAIEMSSFAPTGPNPTAPQQIPFDAVQTSGGAYAQPGKTLVAEGAAIVRDQDPDAENAVSEQLAELGLTNKGGFDLTAGNADTAANARAQNAATNSGTVAEVTADLGGKTTAELQSIRATEVDGPNRVGVLSAVDKELASRG